MSSVSALSLVRRACHAAPRQGAFTSCVEAWGGTRGAEMSVSDGGLCCAFLPGSVVVTLVRCSTRLRGHSAVPPLLCALSREASFKEAKSTVRELERQLEVARQALLRNETAFNEAKAAKQARRDGPCGPRRGHVSRDRQLFGWARSVQLARWTASAPRTCSVRARGRVPVGGRGQGSVPR